MRNSGAVRRAVAGIVLFAAVCALPSIGTGAGDGAVLNGIHRAPSGAKALKARPDTTRHAFPPAAAGLTRPEGEKWKTPPIDVRALSAAEPRSVAEPARVAQSPRQGVPGAGLPLAVAAVVVAACSTALILFVIARASARRRLCAAPVVCPDRTAPGAAPEPDDDVYGTDPGIPAAEDEDGFFGVGRELRGARGEMALAMRLHAGAMGDGPRRSARSACSADASTAERVKVAKRLGIGRGEIDLALRLQKLESTLSSEVKTA